MLFTVIRVNKVVRARFDIDWKAWWVRNGAGAKKPRETKKATKKSLYHKQSNDDVPELPGLFESMKSELGIKEEATRQAGGLFHVSTPTAEDANATAV